MYKTTRTFNRSAKPRYGSGGGGQRSRGKSNKQYIHPSKFIQAARTVEKIEYTPQNSFADFEVHELIKSNVIKKGYITPSPIQDQAIPHALTGKDVIGIANTGTGKTAAFAIPTLHKLMLDPTSYALVVAPTRELAQQIEAECRSFATKSGLHGALLIGGSPMGPQLGDLRVNPRIVIGTPGRIKDHVERGTLKLSKFNIVILDEVDRMVDMGFIDDIRHLLGLLATPRQSLFFSATIDPKIEYLINSFMNSPIKIMVSNGKTSDNVDQNVVEYRHTSEKLSKLHDILVSDLAAKALVFDDTQRNVEKLSNELLARGFSVDAIHGGKSQGQRKRALDRFRRNEINILVATDVAARGIDVADITHVINYSTPNSYDDYIHRIGRTGRADKSGKALTFINQ